MRNINQYPITHAEKIAVLRKLIDEHNARFENNPSEMPIGDITLAALEAILKDLYRATAFDEGIGDD